MSKKIYVGNLPWSATDSSIRDLFARHGEVISARVITDRDTGRSRGFGFVEVEEADATAVISSMNGKDVSGRQLTVNEARPKEPRGDSGGYRRGGSGRY